MLQETEPVHVHSFGLLLLYENGYHSHIWLYRPEFSIGRGAAGTAG